MSKHQLFPFYTPREWFKKRAYVSGGMSGLPNENKEAFDAAAAGLRERGYSVCSPWDTSDILGPLEHHEYLRFDFARILEADFVVALPGWENSDGALAEIHMALRIGLKVWRWENFDEYSPVTMLDLHRAMANKDWGQNWKQVTFDV